MESVEARGGVTACDCKLVVAAFSSTPPLFIKATLRDEALEPAEGRRGGKDAPYSLFVLFVFLSIDLSKLLADCVPDSLSRAPTPHPCPHPTLWRSARGRCERFEAGCSRRREGVHGQGGRIQGQGEPPGGCTEGQVGEKAGSSARLCLRCVAHAFWVIAACRDVQGRGSDGVPSVALAPPDYSLRRAMRGGGELMPCVA